MAKQVTSIQMGAYFLSGRRYNNTDGTYSQDFTSFNGYPSEFGIWNINPRADMEFIDSPTSKALSGYERGNPGGHRIIIDIALKNTNSSETSNIRSLFNLVPSQYERTVVSTTLGSSPVTGTFINLALGNSEPNTLTNAYQGAYIRNVSNTNANVYRIDKYFGTTVTAQAVETIVGYENSDVVNVALFPDKPTIIGISTDNTTSNIIFCNLISSSFGIQRELTIGNQIINLSLRSIDRFQTIPASLQI